MGELCFKDKETVLVFGGAYQGKLDFVKKNSDLNDDDIFVCDKHDMDIDFNKKVIDKFHLFVYSCAENKICPSEYVKDNLDKFYGKVIICDDISNGVVPIDGTLRYWREEVGRCMALLSNNSDVVYRIFCGIGTRLK